MNKYEIYYKNSLIGNCFIKDDYLEYKVINKIDDVFEFLKNDYNGKLVDFPFIYDKIIHIKKFNLKELSYQGSSYLVKKIN